MHSSPKTIDAAKKAAATCKAKALGFIRANPGSSPGEMPKAWSRWLRTIEIEGKIEYVDGGWRIKEQTDA